MCGVYGVSGVMLEGRGGEPAGRHNVYSKSLGWTSNTMAT